ncbi:Na+/H+ antiporter NhaD and related arsenite permeases protein [Herbaspirillum rubrisubalbicans M1]|uniref:sodium:proton antiporter n=1 Tax=Herbaspirillum rubrisubalbicans TaxID=80842 RepID=UPI00073A269C|nr:Na+/H+ antiporter NhaD and related arsenite permeases protein [Herbaspirillum rubrisubalbicans M1]
MLTRFILPALCAFFALLPLPGWSAELDGASLSLAWALPFAGVLLSIAVLPLLAPALWHHHFGKIAAAWGLALLLPLVSVYGSHAALAISVHALVAEYLPFIILLSALFTVAGGICVRGNLHGTPALNTGLLALGTLLASVMGTTGAAMLLIRPLIRANDDRKHTVHVVVFFIFLVANAGGSLTPLGDPPLFLGFLKGVDFFWTARHLLGPMLFLCIALLSIFYLLDRHFYLNREERRAFDPTPDSSLQLEGKLNFLLLLAVVALVLMSGLWKPGVAIELMGVPLQWQNLLRDGALLVVIVLSLWLTPSSARQGNEFGWGPMLEVGKLFAAIFLTIAPVIAMLRAGEQGAFAAVVKAVSGPDGRPDDVMYFWMTGLLSSFLDNAPTYLVFFNTASGDARELMGPLASTLAAISAGAVFMGANSYIGNAPNMMVKAIAEERGVRMPSFFGYLAWSAGILVPLFIVMSLLFF